MESTSQCRHASEIDLASLEAADIPPPAPDGRIATSNDMGFMTQENDAISQEFVNYAGGSKLPVLDGGAAYGVATIAALKAGATVIANDIDARMVNAIARSERLTPDDRERLYLREGPLPRGLDFPAGSLGAVHLSRCMHFFPPADFEEMFARASRWLARGGRLFVVTMSQYHHSGIDRLRTYEERKAAGSLWPGEIDDFVFCYGHAPSYLHSVDPSIIVRLADKFGFIPKRVELFGGPDDLDYVGAVLIKR